MKNSSEQNWLSKFRALPLYMKIVSLWLYIGAIGYFYSSIRGLISIEIIKLFQGVVLWWIANGLVNRNNSSRIFALVVKGIGTIASILVSARHLIPEPYYINLDFVIRIGSYQRYLSESEITAFFGVVALMNIFTVVVLLLPHTRNLFVKSANLETVE